ncbi:hypothetical protein HYH02_006970 [Chlamydomonas schloesseri]|uniref:Uncharacterized protein n=1 Tax=Chlamydomonas schloesseri TaxID=2026947 RepID=A0A836B5Y7_9CHLO|nr:hypothetical protein HYH02_006970 [Chlamydomonas schloesseri]|eukprot:KAG2448388.1 hypothetical protein HYH02_006970 [Chlamydomonas schloesseri]
MSSALLCRSQCAFGSTRPRAGGARSTPAFAKALKLTRRSPRRNEPLRAAPKDPQGPTEGDNDEPLWQQLAVGVAAGVGLGWLVAVGTAVADNAGGGPLPDPGVVGPSTDMLLSAGPDFSFTSLLLFTLCGYWLIKSLAYLSQNPLDGPDGKSGGDQQQQQQQQPPPKEGGSRLTDMGHAHIRSVVNSSVPAPGSEADARSLRNASLARSAAYRVSAAVREAIPRIHSLVEELAGPSAAWPLPGGGAAGGGPPRHLHAEVDYLVPLVYSRVAAERGAKAHSGDSSLCPRERAALEKVLLEEVAERTAAEQVAEFARLAASGQLHPPRAPPSNGGAGVPPSQAAH